MVARTACDLDDREHMLPHFISMKGTIQKQNFKHAELCAFQESGHIVFAYLCGYSCHEVFILPSDDMDCTGFSMIDYSMDSRQVSMLLTGNHKVQELKNLVLAERLELIEVARRLSRIFFGGSVAASVHKNPGISFLKDPVQIDIVDYMRLEYIHYIISELSVDKEEAFMEQGIKEALYTLDHPAMWSAVDKIAQSLLLKHKLNQAEIERIVGPLVTP
jgi:hypothetical protein